MSLVIKKIETREIWKNSNNNEIILQQQKKTKSSQTH